MGEGSTNDMYSFNTQTSQWTRAEAKGALPEPRSFHAMAAVGSSLFIFGGCGTGSRLNDLHRFDTDALEWEQMPTSSNIKVCHFFSVSW